MARATARESASPASSPRKTKSPGSPTKAPKLKPPGLRALQKEWKASLKPWVKDPKFVHPDGTWTVSKTDAKKKFKLDDDDLATLPCELRPSDQYLPMQLYSYNQLMDLAKRKCDKLRRQLEVDGLVYHYHSGSSQSGGVSIVSIANPPPMPAWAEHIRNPQPPPLKILEYTTPVTAVTPDPENIIWTPSKISGPVTLGDACRLYCITPEDIRDLSAHSPWIDLATVAKRALTLHGGFFAHKELVLQRRSEEEDMLDRENMRKSRFRFSAMVLKELEVKNDDGLYDTVGGSSVQQDRVAVLYPIENVCMDDYGCEWEWMPYETAF
ncbi:hypothetical protein B0H11DRAFT_2193590 [Mycena galericulata]|nr:hypothetical protein B0H11DRAFT_2193590 [Mycena galericulata]